MEGPLTKWTNLVNGWQYRWFVLDPTIGVLSYYTSLEKERKGERRGCVKLKGAQVGIDDTEDCTFTITVDNKTFHFQAHDTEERQRWLDALQEVRDLHTNSVNLSEPLTSEEIFTNFDKKIVEADAYLQILISQEDELKKKLPAEKHTDPVLIKLQNLIELIKQTIVCLQIAKHQMLSNKNSLDCKKRTQNAMTPLANMPVFGGILPDENENLKNIKESDESTSKLTQEVTIDSSSSMTRTTLSSSSSTVTNSKLTKHDFPANIPILPNISYSSSGDESDEFYDTNDILGSPVNKVSDVSLNNGLADPINVNNEVTPTTDRQKRINALVNYDELYDDEEEELGSVQNHDSVITYIVSQLRIGMDLTKITLPTFILEKRSTLEMYADFLAHPDLWVKIAQGTSPQARFVACLKWYLSAFHAGRKSSVAKKPYNPILGEVFRCYWDISEMDAENKSSEPNISTSNTELPKASQMLDESSCGGLFTWAPTKSVIFLAEQVSHHPPISAFYAENKDHKIYLNGNLWTKSKFLGLSIGVEMIGETRIYLEEYDEEYVVTFPSGYGRNILSVPWVELGGRCVVTCQKTGYSATVDFKTKPFYNNKKDQVRAECFYSLEKKPFMVVEGEWNNKMYAKYNNDLRQELFIDIKSMPPLRKIVQPRRNQLEYESRLLWEQVTSNLKQHRIQEATDAKSRLEQKQRDDAKIRKEKNVKWELRHFNQIQNEYFFKKPLSPFKHRAQ